MHAECGPILVWVGGHWSRRTEKIPCDHLLWVWTTIFVSWNIQHSNYIAYSVVYQWWWVHCGCSSMKHPRHYYEVIGEGVYVYYSLTHTTCFWVEHSVHVGSACHLYFDVEFKREFNPHSDPITLLEIFIEVCTISQPLTCMILIDWLIDRFSGFSPPPSSCIVCVLSTTKHLWNTVR